MTEKVQVCTTANCMRALARACILAYSHQHIGAHEIYSLSSARHTQNKLCSVHLGILGRSPFIRAHGLMRSIRRQVTVKSCMCALDSSFTMGKKGEQDYIYYEGAKS